MRAICGALNVETQLMAAQMKQKSFRGTGGSHNPDHKSSDAGRSVFEYSDDETDIESDSDNDSDNDDHSNIWFTSFATDVLLYTTCLTQLGNALECPAPEAEHDTTPYTRAIAELRSDQVSTNTDLITEGIWSEEPSNSVEDSGRAHSPGKKTRTMEPGQDVPAVNLESGGKYIIKRSQNEDVQPQLTPVGSEKAGHACSICGKTFSRKSHRKNHEAGHRGSRHHECPKCGKSFTRFNDLKRHQKLHEPRKSPKLLPERPSWSMGESLCDNSNVSSRQK